jgi:hypothetical protein
MPLTGAQMAEADAARRILADEHFQAILDRVVATAVGHAMFLNRSEEREHYRQIVIAVSHIRNEILAVAELPDADKAASDLARSME